MNNPELYALTNELPQKEGREFLAEYINLVQWKQDGGCRIMDIGCGPGNNTTQILLPMVPDSLQELVATDLSPEMIQYARTHHQHPQVSYDVLDIATKNLPDIYYKRFDLVCSLICLHWVQDQRQAMKNIFDMLQPGGDVLLLYFAKNPTFDVLLRLADMEHWKPYMKEVRKYISVYQQVEDVEESLYSLLQEVGFVNITCQCRRKEYVYENINKFMAVAEAVDPFILQLPAHLKQKYRQEMYNEYKIVLAEGYAKTETDNLHLPYTLIQIHARKP